MKKINLINFQDIETKLIQYIQNFVKEKPVIIGLSGGIDSSIVCALAVKALGKDKVKVLVVKNSRYPIKNLNTSREYAKKLGIQIQEVDSTLIRKESITSMNINPEDVKQSSTMDARICDLIIKTFAGLEDRIYIGTINGTERLTGWYPKGNLVGDFCPIGGLLKAQEIKLAEIMGLGYLVETISADASRVCSGCGELPEFKGIPYSILDEILYIYETSKEDELAKRLKASKIQKEIYTKVLNRVVLVNHKNDVFPDYCKINFVE